MNHGATSPEPVAGWARVLAWIIVLLSCIVPVGVLVRLMRGAPAPPVPWYVLLLFAVAVIWVLPLFWIVAIRGRPPRYWFGFGLQHWQSR
jgi:hypothetical protein